MVRRVAMQKSSFCICYLQYLVAISLFTKNKNTKQCRQNGGLFSRGLPASFFRRFWAPFWEGFGRQNRKKTRFGEVRKTDQKKELQVTQKVKQVCTSQGGGPLQVTTQASHVPHWSSHVPHRDEGRLKPYEHTTTCVEARWRIFLKALCKTFKSRIATIRIPS